MSDKIQICKWEEYQHYKDRCPPWIKLHSNILNSEMWVMCDDASRLLAIALMVLAAKTDNSIPANPDYIKKVAHLKSINLKPLIDIGFCRVLADASGTLADARPLLSSSLLSSDSEKGSVRGKTKKPKGEDDADFWKELEALYTWVDLEAERAKMKAWLLTPRGKNRKLTRRFVVNWLNKLDRPMEQVKQSKAGGKNHSQVEWVKGRNVIISRLKAAYRREIIEGEGGKVEDTIKQLQALYREYPGLVDGGLKYAVDQGWPDGEGLTKGGEG